MSHSGYGNNSHEHGGGSSGDNYYDRNAHFSGRDTSHGGGCHEQSYSRHEDDSSGRGDHEYRDIHQKGLGQYSSGDDFSSAAQHAQSHYSSEDKSFFDNALGFLNERKSQYSDPSRYEVDEQHAINAHQQMYGGGSDERRTHDSGTVGAGAAMQAMKMFTSSGSSDGGMDKNKLVGMAMAQAGKLWDQKQGGGANMSGDKQSAINAAADMALKMYMKGSGGSGTGGPSSLMSLANKFLS